MKDYAEFLAMHVLAQNEIVTFRTLSRALKVNVHIAKQMLYDFHKSQNAAQPNSVAATYLIFGKLRPQSSEEDDVAMGVDDPTPAPPSLTDPIAACTLQLVHQDNLEQVLGRFDSVSSLHMYSLGSGSDLGIIADAPQFAEPASSDPVKDLEVFGSILNLNLQRRATGANRPILSKSAPSVKAPPAIKAAPNAKIAEPGRPTAKLDFSKATTKTNIKKEAGGTDSGVKANSESPAPDSQSSSKFTSNTQSSLASTKKASSKTNSIMNSFAKAASHPAKPKAAVKEETNENDVVMSDDGEDDEPMAAPVSSAEVEAAKLAREKKQEQLRKMMEEEDEEVSENEEDEDVPMEEPEPENVVEEKPEEKEIVSRSGNGRKRGRRQVIKKKQTMDANGYFVTIQERAWESFSEDEDEPPATEAKVTATPASSGEPAKGKKAASKGQGNIMSFFQKK